MALIQRLTRQFHHQIATLSLKSVSTTFVSNIRMPLRAHKLISNNLRNFTSTRNPNQINAPASEGAFRAFEQLGGTGTGSSQYSSSESDAEQDEAFSNNDEDRLKAEVLSAALNHVKTTGWNVDAIAAAAEEAGLSSSLSSLFKDSDLVHFFISRSNQELEDYLVENQLNLRDALEWRLQKLVPYANGYEEAIAIISHPENVTQSVTLLLEMADSIAHYSLKDSSTDLNWYTKRIAIAGIYVSSELCMIQDKSPGYSETWKFLDRRCEEFDKMNKGNFSLSSLSSLPLPELIHAGFTTVRNLIGRNAPR